MNLINGSFYFATLSNGVAESKRQLYLMFRASDRVLQTRPEWADMKPTTLGFSEAFMHFTMRIPTSRSSVVGLTRSAMSSTRSKRLINPPSRLPSTPS